MAVAVSFLAIMAQVLYLYIGIFLWTVFDLGVSIRCSLCPDTR